MWIVWWPLVFAFAALASAAPVGKSHYGIVFDAGSSGTRIHVYTWRTGGGGPKDAFDLVSDELLKIKPGLSAYKDRPSEAGASLEPLLAFARSKIPAELIASTPMFLMATAGLRLVGEATKDAILASVCGYLGSTGFLFRCEWATLLDGRDEGLYGWVTVNYLLDALYPGGAQPAGTIDLGGGSVQIVFPTPAVAPSSAPAELSQRLDFGGRSHALHVRQREGRERAERGPSRLEQPAGEGRSPPVSLAAGQVAPRARTRLCAHLPARPRGSAAGRDLAEIWPRSSRDLAEIWPRSGRDLAEI